MKIRFFKVKKRLKKLKFQWRKIICCRSSAGNSGILFPGKQEKVVFKFQVFDERIKRKAKEVVREFSGVTSVDMEERCKLKVIGRFDKFKMMKKLKKIDQHVDIIEVIPIEEAEKQVKNKPPETQASRSQQKAPVDNKKVINKPSDAAGSSNWYGVLQDYGGRAVGQINRENANKLIDYGRGVVRYFRKEDANKGKGDIFEDMRKHPSLYYARILKLPNDGPPHHQL